MQRNSQKVKRVNKTVSHQEVPLFNLGLTLSGGGAKCMAHIGLLQYLAEYGINPDIISGTSAGALVGALYAAGQKPVHILEFFLKHKLFSFYNLSFSKLGLLQTEKIRDYLTPLFPEDSFDTLQKPLTFVATDLRAPDIKIFDSGPLIYPLLGTIAFPGVFTPVEWQGALIADGGIINNFPATLIRNRCRFHIGMHLNPVKPLNGSKPFKNSIALLERIYDIFSLSKIADELALPDVILEPEGIHQYGVFTVKNDELEEIFELGYECAKNYFEHSGADWFATLMKTVIKQPEWLL